MRTFYTGWEIVQTPSGQFKARAKRPTLSSESVDTKQQTASAELRDVSAADQFLESAIFGSNHKRGIIFEMQGKGMP
jgi:hypothetical protein